MRMTLSCSVEQRYELLQTTECSVCRRLSVHGGDHSVEGRSRDVGEFIVKGGYCPLCGTAGWAPTPKWVLERYSRWVEGQTEVGDDNVTYCPPGAAQGIPPPSSRW